MSQIVPLLTLPDITVHRFNHPVSDKFMASFVEEGTFDLHVGENGWRAKQGDVMLSHPGMRFRAAFQGKGFNDTCLSVAYRSAEADGFDTAGTWAKVSQAIRPETNRVRYLYWGLKRAVTDDVPMLAEYCATEIFREHGDEEPKTLYRERTLAWYAERVHAVRERMEQEYDRQHTVSELARSVGMSLFNFTRIFTELAGQPPHSYLRDVRLRNARNMLVQGRSVTETCFDCGFSNLSHFSRSYARRFGMTPSRATA
jgi:AraC-like DNA-binding protein